MPDITNKILNDLDQRRQQKIVKIQENALYVAGKNPPTLEEKPQKKPDNRITIPFAKMAVETLTGYAGRAGIYELLIPNDEISDLVNSQATSREIEIMAKNNGMITLGESARKNVIEGVTSIKEMMRVSLV